jgi:hypothetical protein
MNHTGEGGEGFQEGKYGWGKSLPVCAVIFCCLAFLSERIPSEIQVKFFRYWKEGRHMEGG